MNDEDDDVTTEKLEKHNQKLVKITPNGDDALGNVLNVLAEVMTAAPVTDKKESIYVQRSLLKAHDAVQKFSVLGTHIKEPRPDAECGTVTVEEWNQTQPKDERANEQCLLCMVLFTEEPDGTLITCGMCGMAMCMKCVLNGVVKSYMRQCPNCRVTLNLAAKCERLAGGNEYARRLAQNITAFDSNQLEDQSVQRRCYRKRLKTYLDTLLT
ncbi:MAG: hypothetical protein GY938_20080, partial [Ketobacter sp.]|nr:hypothetical protein [Ketobacter sp.]